MSEALDVLCFYVPTADTERVLDALFAVGAGRLGDYERCAWVVSGEGRFRPLPGADPTIGAVGQDERVAEDKVELTYPRQLRSRVVAALLEAHPYEEPAFHVVENVAGEN